VFKTPKTPGWKSGIVEKWKSGKVEKWKDGKMERWKDGKMERWKSDPQGVADSVRYAKIQGNQGAKKILK